MTQENEKVRKQMQIVCIDDLVPQDHLLRIIEKAIDWSFIYGLVEDKYSKDIGRSSLDPVVLIKLPFIQYLYGIKSMRRISKQERTIKRCRNVSHNRKHYSMKKCPKRKSHKTVQCMERDP